MNAWAGALLVTGCLLGSPEARAGHATDPDVDYLAETLDQWEFRLSPTRLDVGVYENVSVGSYYGLLLLKAPELHARWTFFERSKWAVATQLGYLTFSLRDLDKSAEPDLRLQVVPFEVLATYTYRPDLRFSLGVGYTEVAVSSGELAPTQSGDADEDLFESAKGSLGVSTGRLDLATEYRISDLIALSAEAQLLLFQRGGGAATETLQPDRRTQIVLHQKANADLKTQARGNFGVGVTWAWDTFHLKLGLYRGAYVLPLVGTFVPTQLKVVPELDLSWRF
jgi:hypothetical protein